MALPAGEIATRASGADGAGQAEQSMIPKSVPRFSEKIMLQQISESGMTIRRSHPALAASSGGCATRGCRFEITTCQQFIKPLAFNFADGSRDVETCRICVNGQSVARLG